MNASIRSFLCVTAIVFALVTLAHVVRAATGAALRIDGWDVPIAASWIAAVVTAALAAWGARLAARA